MSRLFTVLVTAASLALASCASTKKEDCATCDSKAKSDCCSKGAAKTDCCDSKKKQ